MIFSAKICFQKSKIQYCNTDWGNGLLLYSRHAIISTYGGLVCWRIYASLGRDLSTACRLSNTYHDLLIGVLLGKYNLIALAISIFHDNDLICCYLL